MPSLCGLLLLGFSLFVLFSAVFAETAVLAKKKKMRHPWSLMRMIIHLSSQESVAGVFSLGMLRKKKTYFSVLNLVRLTLQIYGSCSCIFNEMRFVVDGAITVFTFIVEI